MAKPVIVSYCATFLPREMSHVYRQVCGIASFDHRVVTRTRANADLFPFPRVTELSKSPWRIFNRVWHRVLGRPVPASGSEIAQMLGLCRQERVGLVHVYLGTEALRIIRFLDQFRGARIVSFHGADLSDEYDAQAYAPLWSRAELFLCRSESLRERLLAKGCPAKRIRLNYTGVPVSDAFPHRRTPDWRRGETVRLLQACRLIEKKGLDVTLKAVKLLQAQSIPISLTLAGEGPLEQSLRTLAMDLGISDFVTFRGFVHPKDLLEVYHQHHVFVHPSRATPEGDREGIPNSLLEAMAVGLPVVSTRHSGIPEAVAHDENGLLVETADGETIAMAIRKLIDDPTAYDRIARQAHSTAARRFSLVANREALEAIYHEALKTRAR
jgi:colanic acid/amylovoran biosynthesis glycosyltransferase